MLFALAAIVFALWVGSVISENMFGGFIHLLAVLSVALVIARLIKKEERVG